MFWEKVRPNLSAEPNLFGRFGSVRPNHEKTCFGRPLIQFVFLSIHMAMTSLKTLSTCLAFAAAASKMTHHVEEYSTISAFSMSSTGENSKLEMTTTLVDDSSVANTKR